MRLHLLAVGAPLLAHAQEFRHWYGAVNQVAGGTNGAADGIGAAAAFGGAGDAAFDETSDTLYVERRRCYYYYYYYHLLCCCHTHPPRRPTHPLPPPSRYVADTGGNTLRAVALATGAVTTAAGSGTAGAADGIGTNAAFSAPWGVAVTSTGATVYVGDGGNHLLRSVTVATGAVATAIALESADGTPFGLAMDPADDATLFYACAGDGINAVRFLDLAAGTVGTLMADTDGLYGSFSGISFAVDADADAVATLFVADRENHQVLAVEANTGSADNDVAVVAGAGTPGRADGVAAAAKFNGPVNVAFDAATGVLYVADLGNDVIRLVDPFTGATGTMPDYVSDPVGLAVADDGGGNAIVYATNEFSVVSVNTVEYTLLEAAASGSLSFFSTLPEDVALFAVLGMVLGAALLVFCGDLMSNKSVSSKKPSKSSDGKKGSKVRDTLIVQKPADVSKGRASLAKMDKERMATLLEL